MPTTDTITPRERFQVADDTLARTRADLQPLQVKWHAAHQEQARAKRIGNGQSADGFTADWPIRPYVEAVAA